MLVEYFAQRSLLVQKKDNVGDAIAWSVMHYLRTVPVLNDKTFEGYLNIDTLKERSFDEVIENVLSAMPCVVAYTDEHIYNAFLKLQYQDCIAVVNKSMEYKGILSVHQLSGIVQFLQKESLEGAILTLRIRKQDYSLSSIARIAESSDAQVIGMFVSVSPEDENVYYVHLKFGIQELSKVVAAFEHHGFEVAYVHSDNLSLSKTLENYESLMKYLQI